jgi:tRNA (guanine-N7-)-methyltransferase
LQIQIAAPTPSVSMPRHVFEAVRAGQLTALRSAFGAVLPITPLPILLEVGCGNGHFLVAYASAHPAQWCIGIDLRLERIEKALRKRDRAGLRNLHFLRCEAHDFLRELPANIRLLDVYLLFSDPWPKKRHHKNRLLQTEFLDLLAARAGQGSRLFFRTDNQSYFAAAVEVVSHHSRWHRLPPDPFPFEYPTIFQSRASTFHSFAAIYVPPEAR